ncbi:MAG: NAD(+)/NADH kinase [Pseudomonadota bacterium]
MSATGKLGLCVNPMSGRDVRRLAGRASTMTHEGKRDRVARIAAGAEAVGIRDLYVTREPYNIAAGALELMPLKCGVHVLDLALSNDERDTERSVQAFIEVGVQTLVSLGGDGTNRAIVRSLAQKLGDRSGEIALLPLSTGTNNVYPTLTEPTVVGMAAGLEAQGLLAEPDLRLRSKVLHIRGTDGHGRPVDDVGLIDAVQLHPDHPGNLLPFDPDKISRILLTRAEPTAIGMSPIGGLLEEVLERDDAGLLVELGPGGQRFQAPVSPGLFRPVSVRSVERIPFDVPVVFEGPGVLALDGDRDYKLPDPGALTVCIRRSGPAVVDVAAAMRWATRAGIITRSLASTDD